MRYLYCIHSHDFPLLLSVSFGWISGFTRHLRLCSAATIRFHSILLLERGSKEGTQTSKSAPSKKGTGTSRLGYLNISGWWLQPYVKNMSQNLESSPNFGVKIQKIEKKNTQILCFTPFSGNRSPLPNVHLRFHRWNNGPGRPIVPLALELVPSYKAPKNFDVQNKSFTLTGCVAFFVWVCCDVLFFVDCWLAIFS